MKTPVVVLGATGQVGLFTIARLLEKECRVIAVTRDGGGIADTETAGLSRVAVAAFAGALNDEPSAILVSCGPVGLAQELIEKAWPPATRLDRMIVVGTTSTLSKADSPDTEERRAIAEISLACEKIRSNCLSRKIPLAILSPTLIYGCGMDENLSRVFRWIQRFGFAPLASNAYGLRQPLHVADLAFTVVRALQVNTPAVLESPLGGAGTVTYHEMIMRLFDAARVKRRILRLPRPLVPLAIGVSHLIPGTGRLNAEMFNRQAHDLVFDDSLARDVLGHAPRLYQPAAEDFQLPASIECIKRQLS